MDNQYLSEALEDIQLIKQVIGKTADSLLSLGKIFLYWGILFSVYVIFLNLIRYNLPAYNMLVKNFSFIPIVFLVIFPVIFVLIYVIISRRLPLQGMSKQLMNIWLFIIGFNTFVINLILKHDLPQGITTMLEYRNALTLVTFSFGLYFTYTLTKLQLTKWMSFIYVLAGFFAFIPGKFPDGLFLIVWPLTFLVLGSYFGYKNKLNREG